MNPFKPKKPDAALSAIVEGSNNKTAAGVGNTIIDSMTVMLPEEAKLLPSNLAAIVNVLGKRLADSDSYDNIEIFKIEDKISHNNVMVYRGIINEYGVYSAKLSVIYNEADKEGTNIQFNTLSNIKHHYLKAKGSVLVLNPGLPEMDVIRANADTIFTIVEQQLLNEIVKSSNVKASRDTINVSLQVIMVDAFIRCKILEHPLSK